MSLLLTASDVACSLHSWYRVHISQFDQWVRWRSIIRAMGFLSTRSFESSKSCMYLQCILNHSFCEHFRAAFPPSDVRETQWSLFAPSHLQRHGQTKRRFRHDARKRSWLSMLMKSFFRRRPGLCAACCSSYRTLLYLVASSSTPPITCSSGVPSFARLSLTYCLQNRTHPRCVFDVFVNDKVKTWEVIRPKMASREQVFIRNIGVSSTRCIFDTRPIRFFRQMSKFVHSV